MAFTQILRRIHLYLALFLAPWMLMYGLSILCMNHMPLVRSFYSAEPGQTYVEKEIVYDKPLPTVVDPKAPPGSPPRIDGQAAGDQILRDLGMDGAHWADAKRDGSQVTIGRNNVTAPRSITYTSSDKKIVVKRQFFHWPEFIRWLHKRRGYEQPYAADIAWAVSVDLVIVSILAWGVTGLWMWYKMKPTRRWGTACLATGCVLFAVFVLAI
jgi:hypothetical protein